MADDTATAPTVASPPTENDAPVTAALAAKEDPKAAAEVEAAVTEASAQLAEKEPAEKDPAEKEPASEKPAEAPTESEPEKQAEQADAETGDAEVPPSAADGDDEAQPAVAATTSTAEESKTPSKSKDKSRRKSTGASESKGKKLNKKGSMARILHLDAKPGDYFMVKLKGYPAWPTIVADEDMLPKAMLDTRPVTAKRADGTYREDYADGGKRAHDRTFPVMFLETNEFIWQPNSQLIDLDPEAIASADRSKLRNKGLSEAYDLAAEKHDLDFYKTILQNHQERLLEDQEKERAKAATPAKKSKKSKAKADHDGDLEMPDADDDEEGSETAKKSNKRKAEDSAETPQRSESVKKPKIKLTTNSTPKTANGTTNTPKSSKTQSEPKSSKSKPKKSSKLEETAEKMEKEVVAPKEPDYTAEERHQRKEKEVLFLRHKLQKGLLTKGEGPKEEEMKTMSDYVGKLEAFPDLEVSIIRATKINKVLKAILKLDSIPKEDEFKFKPRSQVLLDKWTQLLAVDEKPSGEAANGVNGSKDEPSKTSAEAPAKAKTNGVKQGSEDASEAAKDTEEKKSEEPAEEKPATEEETKDAAPVEASA